jgi:hypothetical protein
VIALAPTPTLSFWYLIAGFILAVPVVVAIIWGVVRVVSHLGRVHEVIIGREETPWSPGIPSMIERFEAQDLQIAVIEAEFRTNGGSTVKDDLKLVLVEIESLKSGQRVAAGTAVTTASTLAAKTLKTATELRRTGP